MIMIQKNSMTNFRIDFELKFFSHGLGLERL